MRSRIDSARMIGRTLAHYHITAAIGAGGMGEVFRATDTGSIEPSRSRSFLPTCQAIPTAWRAFSARHAPSLP
jgi:hypothetical protein